MNDDARLMFKVADLALASLNGTLDDIGLRQLEDLLENNPLAVEYFQSILWTCVGLNSMEGIVSLRQAKEGVLDREFWDTLSVEEKEAQKVELAEPEPDRQPLRTDAHPKPAPTVSKFSIYSLLLSSAALIFLIVYAYFVSINGGIEVATLTDSLQARWADTKKPLPAGTRLTTGKEWFLLREGYVKLLFDNQTRVVVESPAEFRIAAENQIDLRYGKVYSAVPNEAIGFSVATPNARVIDIGTEFGVLAEVDGNTQLYVLKGKTMLLAGSNSHKVKLEVSEGTAKKIFGRQGEISDIECRPDCFARDIHSKTQWIWRGQQTICLADLVGGGNGFGTGKSLTGIDPVTGQPAQEMIQTRTSTNAYRPVSFNPYVDGVFVPDGKTRQIVSSQGHLFEECPPTSGECFNNIIRAERDIRSQIIQGTQGSSSSTVPCLLMHANAGITFDLQAIRSRFPGVHIRSFRTKAGIEKGALRPETINADFWILVDGKLRYQKRQVKERILFPVEIELSETDRFLTLVTTDGGDPERRVIGNIAYPAIDSDWCMFAEPVLVLQ